MSKGVLWGALVHSTNGRLPVPQGDMCEGRPSFYPSVEEPLHHVIEPVIRQPPPEEKNTVPHSASASERPPENKRKNRKGSQVNDGSTAAEISARANDLRSSPSKRPFRHGLHRRNRDDPDHDRPPGHPRFDSKRDQDDAAAGRTPRRGARRRPDRRRPRHGPGSIRLPRRSIYRTCRRLRPPPGRRPHHRTAETRNGMTPHEICGDFSTPYAGFLRELPGKVRLRRGRAALRPGVSGTAPLKSAGAEGPAPHRRQTARYHRDQHTVLLTDGQRRKKKMVRSRKTENRQTSDVKSLFTPKEMSQVSQEVNSKRY